MARRSRTPSPPALRAGGGWVPHRSSSSSVRRTSSNAAPAAARSTSAWPRSEVASSGGWSTARPAAASRASRTVHGSRTCRSSTWASRPSADQVGGRPGPTAPAPVGARLGEVVEDRAGRRVDLLEQRRDLVGRGARRQPEHLADHEDGPVRRTPHQRERPQPRRGPRPLPRPTAGRARSGRRPGRSPGARSARGCRAPSSARRTEVFTTTRAASWEESCGAGVARSGRASSSADSCSSDQPRSWSARVRGAVVDIRRILRVSTIAGARAGSLHGGDRQVPGDAAGRCLPGGPRPGRGRGRGLGREPRGARRPAAAARAGAADPGADGAPAEPGGRADRALRDRARPHRHPGPRRDPRRDRPPGPAAARGGHDLPLAQRRARGRVVHEGDRRRPDPGVPRAPAAARHRAARPGGAVGGAVLHRGLPGRRALRAPRVHRHRRRGRADPRDPRRPAHRRGQGHRRAAGRAPHGCGRSPPGRSRC